MKVYFRNDTPVRLWIAVAHYSPEQCGGEGGNWATVGWFHFSPGQQSWVVETNNLNVYYFAEAENQATWSGRFGPMYVYQDAFNSCIGIGSTAAEPVGLAHLRMLDGDTVQPLIL